MRDNYVKKKSMGVVQTERVNARHRTSCKDCGELPEDIRLKITTGAGKWQKSTVYCADCGPDHLVKIAHYLQEVCEILEAHGS